MKNQRKSFESAVTSDDSFIPGSEGLITTEEMDNVEDYPLLKCTAPSEGQALPTVNVGQSIVLHFGLEKEGIGKSGIAQKEDYSLLECTAPLQGQALPAVNAGQSNVLHFGHEEEGVGRSWNAQENDFSLLECTGPLQGQALLAVNAGQSNVQRAGCSRRGISSAVLDEEAQLSPIVRTGPPERPPQTAGHSVDSMAGRIGLSVLHRSAPRRVSGTPQLQALLEDLTDPSATIHERDRNSEEETAVAMSSALDV